LTEYYDQLVNNTTIWQQNQNNYKYLDRR